MSAQEALAYRYMYTFSLCLSSNSLLRYQSAEKIMFVSAHVICPSGYIPHQPKNQSI